MLGQGLAFTVLAVGLAVIGVLAWRQSWIRCRYQIRRLPEHTHQDRERTQP